MASPKDKTLLAIERLTTDHTIHALSVQAKSKTSKTAPKAELPLEPMVTAVGAQQRMDVLTRETGVQADHLGGKKFEDFARLTGNIENYIGMAMIPVGVVGPMRVLGSATNGDFYVPLATTEGALVASYHRGARACTLAGGISSYCLVEGVRRSPLFKFRDITELGRFLVWMLPLTDKLKKIVEQTSRHAKLTEMLSNIEGNHLILTFEYHTGDASGQNMVTLCTDAICQYLIANAPVQPKEWYIESNYSGDKKATSLSFTSVRGKKVSAEITLPASVVREVLKTSSVAMAEYWQSSTIGAIQSGAIGAQGHFANGLAALFLATGQDVACVSEAAVGITRMEAMINGDLYACVTLPNLIVGTVGGGTGLPTQRECLEMMDCFGAGKARKFAEICGALVLAGELSIAAALSAGHFSSAHKKFGRKK